MQLQAKQSIDWWVSNDDGDSSFPDSWNLLLRVIHTEDESNLEVDRLFHILLNQWRQQLVVKGKCIGNLSPEDMLECIELLSSKGILKPTENSYNMILHAMQKTSTNSDLAENILERMVVKDGVPKPSIVTFSTILQIHATSGHPRSLLRVQALEQRRKELVKTGWPNLNANPIYKSTLINAYAQAGRPLDCQALWEEWIRDCESDLSIGPPNLQTSTTVLNAWRNHPQRAEIILRQMMELYQKGRLEDPPNIVSYCSLLDAWAKSKLPHAPARAEAILRELPTHDITPNVRAYTSTILAWAKHGDNQKAQSLLKEMIQQGIAPNTNTFNAVLVSIVRPDRASDILHSMRRLAIAYRWDCMPDVVSFTTVLQRFANTGHAEGAQRVWKEMLDSTVEPDIMAYNSLLKAYSEAYLPEQAHSLLELMVEQYLESSRDNYPRPDHASFNTVLSAWAKNGDSERAEKQFQWMQKISASLETAIPNVRSYTNLLNCWAKSKADEESIISRVQSLIQEMEEIEIQPNVVSYAALCKSYGRFGLGVSALEVLRFMASKNIQPNNIIYAQVILALAENCVRISRQPILDARRFGDTPSILDFLDNLMKEMEQRQIYPTITSYSAYLKAISAADIPNKADRARNVLSWMRNAGVKPNDVIHRQIDRILENESRNNPNSISK